MGSSALLRSEGLRYPIRVSVWILVRSDSAHSGQGFKSNYVDIDSGEYWISGCRKDGRDALYSTIVDIDEDALEEHWVKIRKQPESSGVRCLAVKGKY